MRFVFLSIKRIWASARINEFCSRMSSTVELPLFFIFDVLIACVDQWLFVKKKKKQRWPLSNTKWVNFLPLYIGIWIRECVCDVSVVQWLMISLKEEILKAESSLLQASACCPLYGRAHCITAVLQQLNTGYFHTHLTFNHLLTEVLEFILTGVHVVDVCLCLDHLHCCLNGGLLCQSS